MCDRDLNSAARIPLKMHVRLAMGLTCIELLLAALLVYGCNRPLIPVHAADAQIASAVQQTLALAEIHFSPAENLETIDVATLDQAQHTVDVATYAMDDRAIAEELVKLADRGVAIRIYRDQTQYAGELAHGKKGGPNLNQLFAGHKNIQVRVKGVIALQHLKAYAVDGQVLREGSANWSVQGERVQDNSLVLIRDPAAVSRFETDFAAIWDRASNEAVQ